MNLESFGNDKYILLKYFYDNQQNVNDELIVITNKQTVADVLHFRKDKVIRIIDECLSEGLLVRVVSRGKYKISQKGYNVIEIFTSVNI